MGINANRDTECRDDWRNVIWLSPRGDLRIIVGTEMLEWGVQYRLPGNRKQPWIDVTASMTQLGMRQALRGYYNAHPGLREFLRSLPPHFDRKDWPLPDAARKPIGRARSAA